jgi:hypothetical protein
LTGFYACESRDINCNFGRKLCFNTAQFKRASSHGSSLLIPVIRATVPKLGLDDAFEQKNEIAKAVEEELEKVSAKHFFCLIVVLNFL